MGTASFSVGKYSRGPQSSLMRGEVVTSGAYTTSTTASNLEDAGGDITMSVGQVLQVHADEEMRIRFGGVAATASTGHFIPSGQQTEYECTEAGTVSIIDVA